MKKIDLGQTITILANVGVITGIAFLAAELRQNNEMMRAQTRNDIAQSVIELLRDTADTEYIEIAFKAAGKPSELTRIELAKISTNFQIQFRA
jgi:hypothetical protein